MRKAAIAAIVLLLLIACGTRPQPGDDTIQGSGGINAEHQRAKPYLIFAGEHYFDKLGMTRKSESSKVVATPGSAPHPTPLVLRALQLHQSGRLKQAHGLYVRALQVNPEDAHALLKKAVEIEPGLVDAWCNLGNVQLAKRLQSICTV